MSRRPEEKLVWPPLADDLRRLYVDEHLSTAKIAARYGLERVSPKTAESMILYHLKRNGIWRRDKAEHSRKVTEEMVDEWAKRYEAGESLKDIAEGPVEWKVDPVTVFNHLKKRGMKLRDKVEAQIEAVTKFERVPFRGDKRNQAYILGFVWGDCSVEKHGRAIRVRSGTTHPEFANLFKHLFGGYGHIRMYPKAAKVTPAEWNLEVDLDGSFEFLLEKNIRSIPEMLDNRALLSSFLAGFADAEGSIYFHKNGNAGSFIFQLSNTNDDLIRELQQLLMSEQYHPKLYCGLSGPIGPQGTRSKIWQLAFNRPLEVYRILSSLPLRHNEKTTKAKMALEFMNSESVLDHEGYPEGWKDYLAEIAASVQEFIRKAVERLETSDQ